MKKISLKERIASLPDFQVVNYYAHKDENIFFYIDTNDMEFAKKIYRNELSRTDRTFLVSSISEYFAEEVTKDNNLFNYAITDIIIDNMDGIIDLPDNLFDMEYLKDNFFSKNRTTGQTSFNRAAFKSSTLNKKLPVVPNIDDFINFVWTDAFFDMNQDIKDLVTFEDKKMKEIEKSIEQPEVKQEEENDEFDNGLDDLEFDPDNLTDEDIKDADEFDHKKVSNNRIIKKIAESIKEYSVVYLENGMDLFCGSYEQCESYIKDIQVVKFGCAAEEFEIVPEEDEISKKEAKSNDVDLKDLIGKTLKSEISAFIHELDGEEIEIPEEIEEDIIPSGSKIIQVEEQGGALEFTFELNNEDKNVVKCDCVLNVILENI